MGFWRAPRHQRMYRRPLNKGSRVGVPPGEPGDLALEFDAPVVDADPVSWSRRGCFMCWNSQGLRGPRADCVYVPRSVADGGPDESLGKGPRGLDVSVSTFGTLGRLTLNEHPGARTGRWSNLDAQAGKRVQITPRATGRREISSLRARRSKSQLGPARARAPPTLANVLASTISKPLAQPPPPMSHNSEGARPNTVVCGGVTQRLPGGRDQALTMPVVLRSGDIQLLQGHPECAQSRHAVRRVRVHGLASCRNDPRRSAGATCTGLSLRVP